MELFRQYIPLKLPSIGEADMTVDQLFSAYNTGLQEHIDSHASLCRRTITLHLKTPWYSNELREAKRKRRKLENRWLSTQLEVSRQIYREQCSATNRLMRQAKQDFFSQKIEECGGDQKRLANITKELLGEKKPAALRKSYSNN